MTTFGDDYVLTVQKDELEVQRIRLYELLKQAFPRKRPIPTSEAERTSSRIRGLP